MEKVHFICINCIKRMTRLQRKINFVLKQVGGENKNPCRCAKFKHLNKRCEERYLQAALGNSYSKVPLTRKIGSIIQRCNFRLYFLRVQMAFPSTFLQGRGCE